MRRTLVLAALFAGAAANAACFDFSTKTSATPNATSALSGTWATAQSIAGASGSLNDACVNFRWEVTQFTGTSGAGTFSATCMGNVQVAGTASATLTTATSATWVANATGTAQGQPPCQISLSGTATLEATNQIRIPYSGSSCIGPLSGTEVIKR